jgi:hypothetical protein
MGAISFTEDAFIAACCPVLAATIAATIATCCPVLAAKGHIYWVGFFFGSVAEA